MFALADTPELDRRLPWAGCDKIPGHRDGLTAQQDRRLNMVSTEAAEATPAFLRIATRGYLLRLAFPARHAACFSLGMEERRIYRETLQDAAAVVGGVEPLALRLKVSADVVNKWLVGSEKPPLNVFLEALEILAERPWRVAA